MVVRQVHILQMKKPAVPPELEIRHGLFCLKILDGEEAERHWCGGSVDELAYQSSDVGGQLAQHC